MITGSAPGKVVLWGEYAVLTGAPALVMAVNRFARASVEVGGRNWHCRAVGHNSPPATLDPTRLYCAERPPGDAVWAMLWYALRPLAQLPLPEGAAVTLDTSDLHSNGIKLGLGSSAALCVATYGACCRLLGHAPSEEAVSAIHRQFQGGVGSGIDVAAAWHGGTLRFRRAPAGTPVEATAWPLPPSLHVAFVFSGRPASTPDHLARFRDWLDRGEGAALTDLAAASEELFTAAEFLPALTDYVRCLAAVDRAAGLGIFSDAHRHLQRLALEAGVVYPPCGAGGGDIGAAFTADPDAAERFRRSAAGNGYSPLPLETASHGIQVTG
jgi:phosphomevalonate kinase